MRETFGPGVLVLPYLLWSDCSVIDIGAANFHSIILVALWPGEEAQRQQASYRLLAISPKVDATYLKLRTAGKKVKNK